MLVHPFWSAIGQQLPVATLPRASSSPSHQSDAQASKVQNGFGGRATSEMRIRTGTQSFEYLMKKPFVLLIDLLGF